MRLFNLGKEGSDMQLQSRKAVSTVWGQARLHGFRA